MRKLAWRRGRAAGLCLCLLAGCGNGDVDAVGLAPSGLSVDLVAHWTFDDGTGSSVRDSSSNPHHGTINGSTWSWLSQGRFGGALHLEQGDYVSVDNFPDASSGWTVSAWVQIASKDVDIGEVTVISTEDVYKGGWELNLNVPATYHFGFWVGPSSTTYDHCECSNCLRADRWQHIAVVVDGSARTLSFYLDGVLRTRVPVARPISRGVPTLYMGRWATTSPARLLVGSLDDVTIWGRTLVAAEIVSLTRAPAP
jgi:hypothetical protein